MKRVYDLVFGLGGACSCSKALRQAGLQYASFPFDWVAGSDLVKRVRLLVSGLPGWLDEATMKLANEDSETGKGTWRNEHTGILFPHDFTAGVNLASQLPGAREKYCRRWDRLVQLIDKSKRVLAVWIDVPACPLTTQADGESALQTLKARWPGVNFELCRFSHIEGLDAEARRISEVNGVRTVAFDLQDKDPLTKGWVANYDLIAQLLASDYKVIDYRSSDEKQRWVRICRAKERDRFKGSGWWSRNINRIEYKLYRHLQKFLSRRGLIG